MFNKTVIENKKLKEENEGLRDEVLINNLRNRKIERLLNQIESDLFKIQDIDHLGIKDKEKRLNRNVIINKIINDINKELPEFLNDIR